MSHPARSGAFALVIAIGASVQSASGAAAPAPSRHDEHGRALTATGAFAYTNALAKETSPYLQQHAHDPVHWLPWGAAAFAKAKAEDKPIFLSVGYSSCHWCHVMGREVFSDEGVAALLDASFVPIKVDREERPDIDGTYLQAVQLMTGGAGWPLSVWLTPDLEPFDGGTYIPRDAFALKLRGIASSWQDQRVAVQQRADAVAMAVRQASTRRQTTAKIAKDALPRASVRLGSGFDAVKGGWGPPKFPEECRLLYFLDAWQARRDRHALQFALTSLDAMQSGGIHDHVGGGFARYTTDADWLVPHFEKMLYTQAWLGRAYLEAYRLTGRADYRRTAEGILRYVRRDMALQGGGLCSAEDADSGGEEGTFYVWTPAEIEQALGTGDGAVAAEWFGVTEMGNFPERPGASILTERKDAATFASAHGMTEAALAARIEVWRARLLAARSRRERPGRDDKVLADWNGMMIGTLAIGSRILSDPSLADAATKAARFVLDNLQDRDGRLLHSWAEGQASTPAFLDDYAALVDGLVELNVATGDARWLAEAEALHARMYPEFPCAVPWAHARTGPRHQPLLAKAVDANDGDRPSGNSLAAWDAVRLWRLTGDTAFRDETDGILAAFAPELNAAMPSPFLCRALLARTDGEPGAPVHEWPVAASIVGVARAVAAGTSVSVDLIIRIAPGWHLPVARPGSSSTTLDAAPLEVKSDGPFALHGVSLPAGHALKLGFDSTPVHVLTGSATLTVVLDVPEAASPGPETTNVWIGFQACDASHCLAPAILRVAVPFDVRPRH